MEKGFKLMNNFITPSIIMQVVGFVFAIGGMFYLFRYRLKISEDKNAKIEQKIENSNFVKEVTCEKRSQEAKKRTTDEIKRVQEGLCRKIESLTVTCDKTNAAMTKFASQYTKDEIIKAEEKGEIKVILSRVQDFLNNQ
jgi:hypothetical protein